MFGSLGVDYAIEVSFYGCKVSCRGVIDAWLIDFVAAGCKSYTMVFFFLKSDVTYGVTVCCPITLCYVVLCYEETCVCAFVFLPAL